jgi:hypothetical protein
MRLASAALVPSVALAVGCGESSRRPERVRSASFTLVSATKGFGSCTGRGAYDFERQLGGFTLDCTKLGGGRVRFREAGAALYLGGDRAFAGAKRWISSDLPDEPQSIIGFVGGLDPFYGRGPSQMLDYLRSHGRRVSKLGSEKVRGTATTRYRGTLPGAHESLPVTLWADAAGRVRRVRTRYSSGVPVTVTVDFRRFGVPVRTVAPPRATVMTSAEYQAYARKQLERRTGGLLDLYGGAG